MSDSDGEYERYNQDEESEEMMVREEKNKE